MRAQHKVKLAQHDCMPHEAARELHNEHVQHLDRLGRNGPCNVLGPHWVQTGVQSNP